MGAVRYLVTSHEAQVAKGLAALSNLRGTLVRDVFTPAGINGLNGTAVLPYSYQSCRQRGGGGRGGGGGGGRETRKCVSLTTFLMQM